MTTDNHELNRNEVERLKGVFGGKSLKELMDIWEDNDRNTYTAEAFEAIRLIFVDLGVGIPEQNTDPNRTSRKHSLHDDDHSLSDVAPEESDDSETAVEPEPDSGLLRCADCGHKVSTNAPACPGCGAPPQGEPFVQHSSLIRPDPVPAQPTQKSGNGCLLWGSVIVLVFAVLIIISSSGSEFSSGVPSVSTEKFMAETVCKKFVERRLKAPSTATFSANMKVTGSGGSYRVLGQVDAQNSFGAAIRNTFACRTRFNGGDVYMNSNWSLVGLQME